jgi:hypothetical protein
LPFLTEFDAEESLLPLIHTFSTSRGFVMADVEGLIPDWLWFLDMFDPKIGRLTPLSARLCGRDTIYCPDGDFLSGLSIIFEACIRASAIVIDFAELSKVG